jgi:hypothetical protein
MKASTLRITKGGKQQLHISNDVFMNKSNKTLLASNE